MKKCPENKQLYRFDDPELSAEERKALEAHLQQCSVCRQEIEALKSAETSFRAQANAAFVPGVITKGAMSRIRLDAKDREISPSKGKKYWFWILAPGMALILLAALFNSKPGKVGHKAMVSCHASSDNSLVNEKIIEFGRQIEMQHLPLQLNGNFVFTLAATQTSSFEHSGTSRLVSADFDRLEFQEASATFTLVSGNPVAVKINDEIREIDVGPLLIRRTGFSASMSGATASAAETLAASSAATVATASFQPVIKPVVPVKATDALPLEAQNTQPSLDPNVKNATDEASATHVPLASETNPRVNETVNPFLDKPLELNGN